MCSEMNIIWKKDKLQKYSKESITSPVRASGDCVELHCQLCGASDHLQLITNNRLDETLRLYFGVHVPPDGVICESCVKCMKITEGFSALVHASFNKTFSEDSLEHGKILSSFSPGTTNLPTTNPQKEILSLLNTKISLEAPRKRVKRKITKTSSTVVFKKKIIACSACGQKYPMFIPSDGTKTNFVCSRCHKQSANRNCKKNNIPTCANRVDLRCKTDLKRTGRLNSLLKKPKQINQKHSAMKIDHPNSMAKHQCTQCPKKYTLAENLATHLKVAHEGKSDAICSICGKKIKSKELLDIHMREHAQHVKTFRCIECMRSYKSSRALETHYIYHEKQKIKSFTS